MTGEISIEFTEDELEATMYAVHEEYADSDRRARVALAQSKDVAHLPPGYEGELADSAEAWREEANMLKAIEDRLRDKLTAMREAPKA